MGSSTSKLYTFKPLDYAEVKKDSGIPLDQYVLRDLASQYQIPKSANTTKPIQQIVALIRAIHQNQEHVLPIQFELLFGNGEILVRLKRYPAV